MIKETNPLRLELHHQELSARDPVQEAEERRGITSLPSDATNMDVRNPTSLRSPLQTKQSPRKQEHANAMQLVSLPALKVDRSMNATLHSIQLCTLGISCTLYAITSQSLVQEP